MEPLARFGTSALQPGRDNTILTYEASSSVPCALFLLSHSTDTGHLQKARHHAEKQTEVWQSNQDLRYFTHSDVVERRRRLLAFADVTLISSADLRTTNPYRPLAEHVATRSSVLNHRLDATDRLFLQKDEHNQWSMMSDIEPRLAPTRTASQRTPTSPRLESWSTNARELLNDKELPFCSKYSRGSMPFSCPRCRTPDSFAEEARRPRRGHLIGVRRAMLSRLARDLNRRNAVTTGEESESTFAASGQMTTERFLSSAFQRLTFVGGLYQTVHSLCAARRRSLQ